MLYMMYNISNISISQETAITTITITITITYVYVTYITHVLNVLHAACRIGVLVYWCIGAQVYRCIGVMLYLNLYLHVGIAHEDFRKRKQQDKTFTDKLSIQFWSAYTRKIRIHCWSICYQVCLLEARSVKSRHFPAHSYTHNATIIKPKQKLGLLTAI